MVIEIYNIILDENAWKDYHNILLTQLKNKCHTRNRFNCYENTDAQKLSALKAEERKTTQAQFYYNAPDCVVKIFGASSYIVTGLFALFSAIIIIF